MTKQEQHGTHNSYNAGCRCEPCKQGHSQYVNQKNKNRRAAGKTFIFVTLDSDGISSATEILAAFRLFRGVTGATMTKADRTEDV